MSRRLHLHLHLRRPCRSWYPKVCLPLAWAAWLHLGWILLVQLAVAKELILMAAQWGVVAHHCQGAEDQEEVAAWAGKMAVWAEEVVVLTVAA